MIGRGGCGIPRSCWRCAFPLEHLLVRGGDFLRGEKFIEQDGLPAVADLRLDPEGLARRSPECGVDLFRSVVSIFSRWPKYCLPSQMAMVLLPSRSSLSCAAIEDIPHLGSRSQALDGGKRQPEE